MGRRIVLILGIAGLVLGFQNCGGGGAGSSSSYNGPSEVIANASQFTKILFDPQLEMGPSFTEAYPILNIDLIGGTLALTPANSSSVLTCQIDSSRLTALRSLIAQSEICEPSPPPPGYVTCMGMAAADIELSSANSSIMLSRVVCDNGTFLCGGSDATLRSMLADLRDNPPTGCH